VRDDFAVLSAELSPSWLVRDDFAVLPEELSPSWLLDFAIVNCAESWLARGLCYSQLSLAGSPGWLEDVAVLSAVSAELSWLPWFGQGLEMWLACGCTDALFDRRDQVYMCGVRWVEQRGAGTQFWGGAWSRYGWACQSRQYGIRHNCLQEQCLAYYVGACMPVCVGAWATQQNMVSPLLAPCVRKLWHVRSRMNLLLPYGFQDAQVYGMVLQ
jgi:hypothetical protein